MSGKWPRLAEAPSFTAGRFAVELAAPLDAAHEDHIVEQAVFLAADLAASAALEDRYPIRGGAE